MPNSGATAWMRLERQRQHVVIGAHSPPAVTPAAHADSPSTPVPATELDDYRLGPDDVLQIIVARHPEFSVPAVKVTTNGTIQLPVVNDFKVSGMTLREVDAALTKALRIRLLRPEVTVLLRAGACSSSFWCGASSPAPTPSELAAQPPCSARAAGWCACHQPS